MRKSLFVFILLLVVSGFSFALERQSNADYRARRIALSKLGDADNIFLVLAEVETESQNAMYGFRQDENYYYLTGLPYPGGAVLVVPEAPAKDGRPAREYKEVLFLPARNLREEKWTGVKPGPEDSNIRELTGFDRVLPLDRMRDELANVLPQTPVRVLTNKTAQTEAIQSWLERINAFPGPVHFGDASKQLGELRARKDAGEVALIKKAVAASVAAHFAAMKAMEPNVTEYEIGALMQYEFSRRGCERPAYEPIVGSGFNSTVLHYAAGPKVMQDGDIVVLDVGGEYSMYASDITRTLPANGRFTPRQREIYDVVLGAQQAAIKAFKSGESTLMYGPNSLNEVARNYINTHGKDLHGASLGKYFIHGVGHRVGLNVHDPGPNEAPLRPGDVFTIEPGIYIPEENLGVRIEDTFYVDQNGNLINLSGDLPKAADDVENAMKH